MAEESILMGGSSGAVLMALEKTSEMIDSQGLMCACVRGWGDRYLDTIYPIPGFPIIGLSVPDR